MSNPYANDDESVLSDYVDADESTESTISEGMLRIAQKEAWDEGFTEALSLPCDILEFHREEIESLNGEIKYERELILNLEAEIIHLKNALATDSQHRVLEAERNTAIARERLSRAALQSQAVQDRARTKRTAHYVLRMAEISMECSVDIKDIAESLTASTPSDSAVHLGQVNEELGKLSQHLTSLAYLGIDKVKVPKPSTMFPLMRRDSDDEGRYDHMDPDSE